jgi:5-methylcytosine-specific restriction endonuclease McrA
MDTKMLSSVVHLSNDELLARVKQLAGREREFTASLIAHLTELDERRLYLAEGYSSLFTYCTQELRLSEHAAYGRIEAARLIRKFPVLLEMLEHGSVNLTTVCLLAGHLTSENHQEVLEQARYKSKREVEEFLARLHPQPPVSSTIRRLPTPSHITVSPLADTDLRPTVQATNLSQDLPAQGLSSLALASPRERPATIVPLAPERYQVQFTANAETYKKLRLAQDLLRHQIPDGNPAEIFDRALTALLEALAKKKLAATDRPRESRDHSPGSRHIPAEVKRAVWLRDGGRCAFVSRSGHRCSEQGFLEFHHVTPHASGGPPTVNNLQLRCRAHNGYEAELDFGTRNPSVVREPRSCYRSPRRVYSFRVGEPSATRSGPSWDSPISMLPPDEVSTGSRRWLSYCV